MDNKTYKVHSTKVIHKPRSKSTAFTYRILQKKMTHKTPSSVIMMSFTVNLTIILVRFFYIRVRDRSVLFASLELVTKFIQRAQSLSSIRLQQFS